MKLAHTLLTEPIRFKENRVPVLVLENPVVFRKLAAELVYQSEGGEGAFIVSKNDVVLDCSKHLNVFLDFIHTATIEKRIQTKVLTSLLCTAQQSLAQETHQLSYAIQEYLGKLSVLAEYPVAYDQSENLLAILKAMDFRIDLSDLSACEALYEQISLIHNLLPQQCIVLINAKAFFSAEELAQLYKMFQYQKINLLLLENHMPSPFLSAEDVVLFDSDMCELHLDSFGNVE